MKVWERMKIDFKDVREMGKERFVEKEMLYKITACDLQAKCGYLNSERMVELCKKHQNCCNSVEAMECLREYIESET